MNSGTPAPQMLGILRPGDPHASRANEAHETLLSSFRVGPVIDLCCGDGALLADLAARGIDAVGLDPDGTAVATCRASGLTAYQLRWQDYLPRLEVGSVGGLFITHHRIWLDAATVTMLLRLSARVLAPDGCLVIELSGRQTLPDPVDGISTEAPDPVVDPQTLALLAAAEDLWAAAAIGDEGHGDSLTIIHPHRTS